MKDENLLLATLAWNLPSLRQSEFPGARRFRLTLGLSPLVLSGERRQEHAEDPQPGALEIDAALDRSAQLILGVLRGENQDSALHYSIDESDPSRTLESQVRLWLFGKDERDYASAAGQALTSGYSQAIKSQLLLQIALWSRSEGHRSLSFDLYQKTLALSTGHLRQVMRTNAQWFDPESTYIQFDVGPKNQRTDAREHVTRPWISELLGNATKDSLLRSLRDDARRNTPARTFGRNTAGYLESEAAVLQAEWSGAFWLLPRLYAASSAIILQDHSSSSSQVATALSRYIKASGSDLPAVLMAHENRLDSAAFSRLFTDELHSGDAVWDESAWVSACTTLWDQLPADAVAATIARLKFERFTAIPHPSGNPGREVSLLGRLGELAPQSWSNKVRSMPNGLKGVALRALRASAVKKVDAGVLREAIYDELQHPVQDWAEIGWESVLSACQRIGLHGEERRIIMERLPAEEAVIYAEDFAAIIGDAPTTAVANESIQSLTADAEGWDRGFYAGHTRSQAILLAVASRQAGFLHKDATGVLLRHASDARASSTQAREALEALTLLLQSGLLSRDDIPETALTLRTRAMSFWDDEELELQLESIQRTQLRVECAPDTQVRAVIMDTLPDQVRWSIHRSARVRAAGVKLARVSSNRASFDGIDVIVLQALFDAEPSVQEMGVIALAHSSFSNPDLIDVGWDHINSQWPTMPRNGRAAVAYHLNSAPAMAKEELYALAIADRSVYVREAAREGSEGKNH